MQRPICTNDDPDAPRVPLLISSVSFMLTALASERSRTMDGFEKAIISTTIKPLSHHFSDFCNVSKLRLVFQVIVMFSSLSANVIHVLF